MTIKRKRGGRAYHSVVEPHLDFIRQQRLQRKTWQEIADLLFSEKGIRVTLYAPYRFYRRYLKRSKKPHWESQPQLVAPEAKATPPHRSQAGSSPLPPNASFRRPDLSNINTDSFT